MSQGASVLPARLQLMLGVAKPLLNLRPSHAGTVDLLQQGEDARLFALVERFDIEPFPDFSAK